MTMRKWQIMVASALVLLVMVLSPVAVLAAEEEPTAEVDAIRPRMKGGLAIVAPRVTLAGQPMSLAVFARQTLEPVAGAGVWAVTQDSVDSLREDLKVIKEKGTEPAESEDEAVLSPRGFFLGRTDGKGKLTHTFTEAGNFVLVAIKAHYWPDCSYLVVRYMKQILGIHSPYRGKVGEAITINVFQKGNQEPVGGAGVWAIGRDNLATAKEKFTALREANQLQDTNVESLLKSCGGFLGTTNSNGKLVHTFDDAGRYLLVTWKKGYIPGYHGIVIMAPEETVAPDNGI